MDLKKPEIVPPLDENLQPPVLANHAFLNADRSSGDSVPLAIASEGKNESVSVFKSEVFAEGAEQA